MIFATSSSGLLVPSRRRMEIPLRCPDCGKRRRWTRKRQTWRNRFRFLPHAAAGDPLVDASGNPFVDGSSNPRTDNTAGNSCCCGSPSPCVCCSDSTPASYRIVVSGTFSGCEDSSGIAIDFPAIDGTYTVTQSVGGAWPAGVPDCAKLDEFCEIAADAFCSFPNCCWMGPVTLGSSVIEYSEALCPGSTVNQTYPLGFMTLEKICGDLGPSQFLLGIGACTNDSSSPRYCSSFTLFSGSVEAATCDTGSYTMHDSDGIYAIYAGNHGLSITARATITPL